MKKICSAARFLLILMLLCALPVSVHASDSETVFASNPGVTIYINERRLFPVDADGAAVSPLIIEGTTYLPVRAVSEALGLSVEWDGASQSVRLFNGEVNEAQFSVLNPIASSFDTQEISVSVGGISVYLNSSPIVYRTADGEVIEPFVCEGTTYLPLRAISETLGLDVEWHDKVKSITISPAKSGQVSFASVNVPSFSYVVGCAPCSINIVGSNYFNYMYDVSEFRSAQYSHINDYAFLLEEYGFVFDPASSKFVNNDLKLEVSPAEKALSDTFSVYQITVIYFGEGSYFFREDLAQTPSSTQTPSSQPPSSAQIPSSSQGSGVSGTSFDDLYLYSNDGKTYLGKVTASQYEPDSIWNEFGTYGNKYSAVSIWNEFGTYGSSFSNESAFNPFATKPPKIVDAFGNLYGYLTANSFMQNAYSIDDLRQYNTSGELSFPASTAPAAPTVPDIPAVPSIPDIQIPSTSFDAEAEYQAQVDEINALYGNQIKALATERDRAVANLAGSLTANTGGRMNSYAQSQIDELTRTYNERIKALEKERDAALERIRILYGQ